MSIPTFSNGDSMGDVRLFSLNPAITEVNRLTGEVTTLKADMTTAKADIDTAEAGLVAVNSEVDALANLTIRTKVEASWSTPIVIPTGAVNLISLLKAVTPTSGSLTSPLIDLVNDKIKPLNKNKTMMIKLSMAGTYGSGGASADKAILLSLTGGVTDAMSDFKGGGLFTAENAVITFISMVSVDENGNATTLGITPTIQSFVRTFTTTRVLLVIDQ